MSFTRGEDFWGHLDQVVASEDLMIPLLWSFSAMIAHTLNNLDHPDEEDFAACDPKQCAPCDGLYRIHAMGVLGNLLRPYIQTSGPDWDWWTGDEDTGDVDWAWVTARTWPGAQDF